GAVVEARLAVADLRVRIRRLRQRGRGGVSRMGAPPPGFCEVDMARRYRRHRVRGYYRNGKYVRGHLKSYPKAGVGTVGVEVFLLVVLVLAKMGVNFEPPRGASGFRKLEWCHEVRGTAPDHRPGERPQGPTGRNRIMNFVTPAHVHALASAEFSDLPVLAIDGDGQVE